MRETQGFILPTTLFLMGILAFILSSTAYLSQGLLSRAQAEKYLNLSNIQVKNKLIKSKILKSEYDIELSCSLETAELGKNSISASLCTQHDPNSIIKFPSNSTYLKSCSTLKLKGSRQTENGSGLSSGSSVSFNMCTESKLIGNDNQYFEGNIELSQLTLNKSIFITGYAFIQTLNIPSGISLLAGGDIYIGNSITTSVVPSKLSLTSLTGSVVNLSKGSNLDLTCYGKSIYCAGGIKGEKNTSGLDLMDQALSFTVGIY